MIYSFVLLDGQPPKYRNTIENTSEKPRPGATAKSPSPPVRRSNTVKSDSSGSSHSKTNTKIKESHAQESEESLGGIMYCEDYAEIVENEEGDYSRYSSFFIVNILYLYRISYTSQKSSNELKHYTHILALPATMKLIGQELSFMILLAKDSLEMFIKEYIMFQHIKSVPAILTRRKHRKVSYL